MTTTMAADLLAKRRMTLQTSRSRWSRTDRSELEAFNEGIVQNWLTSISKEETKPEVVLETTAKTVKETDSKDDDLALGVEASLYGKRSFRTVRDFLRSSQDLPALSRWNSFASALSTRSEVSVMDVLNMLQDDPEEFLLDLGFGIDEPDITGRIPARFLSYQSNARGINFQLFLDAQQSRNDFENPDVRSRFRQLEVLQQVTTTFSNLVGAQSQTETRERRKRVATILRRAAKKTLRQERTSQAKLSSATSAQSDPEYLLDKRIPPKRSKVSDDSSLSPLKEERSVSSEPVVRVTTDSLKLASVPSSLGKGTREPLESFELEEIQSVDEGSVLGKCSGPVDPGGGLLDSHVMRTNSYQSDSSGFLEEPFIPAVFGSELKGRLDGISQDDTKSRQNNSVHTKEPHASTENHSHTDSSTSPSINSVLGEENSGSIQNTVDTHTVLETADSDSDHTKTILTEKRNSDYSSPDISPINSNGVYTLAYFVQMEPVSYPAEIRDRLQTPDQRFCTQSTSLFEELQSAETNYSPAVPGTIVENTVTTPEVCEPVVSSETAVSDPITESQYQTVNPDGAVGRISPTALKRRRQSFSRRSCSDVFYDSGVVQTPTTYSPFTSVETSTPYLWNSMERSRDVRCLQVRSMSLDTGLAYEEEDHRWECALWAGTQQCFYCGSPVRYNNSWAKLQPELPSNLPYSLNELEDMMKCIRKFRTVLTEIELRLEEEQASVLGPLSESYREEVEDVLRLRAAVKEEASVLEQQLSDLVHHYDDSIKLKLNRLLDEQSRLCSQLRIVPSEPPGPQPASTRNVSVQCCLPPVTSSPQRCCHHHCTCHTHQRTWQDPHRSPYQTQWDSNYKPDQLDFVAFIKSLKNSLQLSLKSTSLE